jgi:glycosyltransferase involved in cell wall biosynthesis
MPRIIPKKTVVTIHDMGFHHLPQLYKKRQVHIHEIAVREAVKRAARIITVSEFTGRDLVQSYGADPSRIAITPLGVDHTLYRPITDTAAIDECLTRHHLSRPFFITIGRIEAKKNIVTLMKAFTDFKSRRGIGDPHKLVLAGIPGFGYEEIKRAIVASSVKDSIVELGYVPEVDKPLLLNAATALIHPSKYEGFGIPVVEAMASGCPVLSSNATSLPEVIGEGNGLFFSPDDAEAMVAAMDRVVSDDELVTRVKAAGLQRASGFTWEQTAKLTLPVLTAW